ncbi:MAG: hypothetical protein HRT61_00345 [Ekhidna sp.]|nr:hypothetical protein [Ekhidna sp.]
MVKIIQLYREVDAINIQWLANRISTIEQRYQEDGQISNNIADYFKHPSKDIWFFYFDEVSPHMGDIGSVVMGFLLGSYAPTGNPIVNTEVLQVIDITDEEALEYNPPEPEEIK